MIRGCRFKVGVWQAYGGQAEKDIEGQELLQVQFMQLSHTDDWPGLITCWQIQQGNFFLFE